MKWIILCTIVSSPLLLLQVSSSSNQLLLIWEVESDHLKSFLPSALSPSSPSSLSSLSSASLPPPCPPLTLTPDLSESVLSEQRRFCRALDKRDVSDHHWDSSDGRLLVLTASTKPDEHQNRKTYGEVCELMLAWQALALVIIKH